MSSEASRLAVSIGGVEERVSSEAKLVQQERANLEKYKRRLQAGKVRARWGRCDVLSGWVCKLCIFLFGSVCCGKARLAM